MISAHDYGPAFKKSMNNGISREWLIEMNEWTDCGRMG